MKNPKTGLMRILYAAKYSRDGIIAIFKSEAAFRQDCLICAILFVIAMFVDVSSSARCALVVPLFILLIAEILNSAVEKCIDIITPDFHPLAKVAKDAGSAAVFLALINIVVCWGIVFLF